MKKILLSTFVVYVLLTYGAIAKAAYFAPNDPGVNIGMNLDAGFEPSGVVWHNRMQSIFVVWDNGKVAQIDAEGNILHPSVQVGGDLEGITLVDDQSNFLYLLVEFPQQMKEYDISTGRLTGRVWNLQGMPGNAQSGAEALTYNRVHNEFYVGAQLDGQVYVYSIDLNSPGDVNFSRIIRTGINTDIAGLSYSEETRHTYAVFDALNIIQEYDENDVLVSQFDAPGADQEGIALMPGCPGVVAPLLIAQDSGGILKFNSYPITCPAPAVDERSTRPNGNGRPIQLGKNDVRLDALALLTPGPTTAVKLNVHSFDSKGEYSYVSIPSMPKEVTYRVDIDARATVVDTVYPLLVMTKSQFGSTSKSQMINSAGWQTYSYTITVPANSATEVRILSSIAAGRNSAGVTRQHLIRGIHFTAIPQQRMQLR